MNNKNSVSEWRQASVAFQAAFMGYGPGERDHKQSGYKFARVISPGDIILIARRYRNQPEVVGFGVVNGRFKTSLRGFRSSEKDRWKGSLRQLSPFVPLSSAPPQIPILKALFHTIALRQLHPDKSQTHRIICDWMERILSRKARSKVERRLSKPNLHHERTLIRALSSQSELEFEVRTSEEVRLARNAEAKLLEDYRQWIGDQQRKLSVAGYKGLRCDAYEKGRGNLIEAKSSRKREYIRMAVGQLLDYSYLGREELGNPNMAILLPNMPHPKLTKWLSELRIAVIWKERRAFLDNANGQFT